MSIERLRAALAAVVALSGVAVANAAPAVKRPSVDLDADNRGYFKLAEAIGACRRGHPGFKWCNDGGTSPATVFTETRTVLESRSSVDGSVSITLEVVDHGFGFLAAVSEAEVAMQGAFVTWSQRETLVMKPARPVAAERIAKITFAFAVDGYWEKLGFWGPKMDVRGATLRDAQGAVLSEASFVAPRRERSGSSGRLHP